MPLPLPLAALQSTEADSPSEVAPPRALTAPAHVEAAPEEPTRGAPRTLLELVTDDSADAAAADAAGRDVADTRAMEIGNR